MVIPSEEGETSFSTLWKVSFLFLLSPPPPTRPVRQEVLQEVLWIEMKLNSKSKQVVNEMV